MSWDPTIAETAQGQLRGQLEDGLHVFRGVPFAEPPVGDLRWRDPQPLQPWSGVRDALAFGPISVQTWMPSMGELGAIPQPLSEDCLYLNVWTPGLDDAARPVLFWIHGGGFTLGSGSEPGYSGDRLAARGDVVVVTINYRLGALGFLADPLVAGADESPGNYGFKDQVAALAWVRENIDAFGGDPDNVTIFGESAGGASVATMLGTPTSDGLFQRAIMQSGGADQGITLEQATNGAPLFYRAIGLGESPDTEELRAIPAQRLLEGQEQLQLDRELIERLDGELGLFAAVIDGDFLDAKPIDAVRSGRALDVDLLAGTIRDEWTLLAWALGVSDLNEEAAIGAMAPLCGGVTQASELFNSYRDIRVGRGESTEAFGIYNAIMTDRVFRVSTRDLLDVHSDGPAGTYGYLFNQESPMLDGTLGAPHAIDIPFVFGTADRTPNLTGAGGQVDQLSGFVMDAWINFARSGNPATNALPGWPQHRPDQAYTMVLGPDVKTISKDREEELALWR